MNAVPHLSCEVHKGMQLIALSLKEVDKNQRFVCSKCMKKHQLDCRDIIFIDDIINSEENTIFDNWPTFKQNNNNILAELNEIIEDEGRDSIEKSPFLIVQDFFDEFQKRFSFLINNCMKRILSDSEVLFITKESLLENYNQLSQKQKLKECIQAYKFQQQGSMQNIENMIQSMNAEQSNIQAALQQKIDSYKKTKEKLQLQLPRYYMESSMQQLINIEEYFYDKKLIIQQPINEIPSTISIKNQPSISSSDKIMKLIQNRSNFCNDTFINQTKCFLDQVSTGMNRISFDQMHYEGQYPLEFDKLDNQQFKLVEAQVCNLIEINKQFYQNENLKDFQSINELLLSLQKYQHQLSKSTENTIVQHQLNLLGQIDKTFTCSFVKSNYDSYSLTNQMIRRDSTNRIEIKQIKPGWQVQSYLDQVIEPQKKYILRVQFDPFISNQHNYRIYIGIIEERFHENKWLDSSPFLFSNNPISGCSFNKVVKGFNINHESIRYDKKMRFLEFQMCLQDKHFLIADFPEYSNITEAEDEKFLSLSLEKSYKLLIESESVQKLKIFYFSEVKEFPKPTFDEDQILFPQNHQRNSVQLEFSD